MCVCVKLPRGIPLWYPLLTHTKNTIEEMWYGILKSCHENNSYAWESITVKEQRQVWQGHFVGRFENDEVMHMLHVSTKANEQKTSHLLTYALKMCSLDHGPKQTLDAFFLFYFYLEV